jgi:hypothetical protein
MKYQVVFFSSINEEEVTVKQKFNSTIEANKWADDCEYNYSDIAIDEDGNEYWKTFYRYYNPEDKEIYTSYEVKVCL